MLTHLRSEFIDPVMAMTGFTRYGNVWNRSRNGLFHIVEIQRSQSKHHGESSFTINVGVASEIVYHVMNDSPIPVPFPEVYCFPRTRIGRLLAEHQPYSDVWWTLGSSESVRDVGSAAQSAVQTKCIPFLDQFHSLEDLARIAKDPIWHKLPIDYIAFAIVQYITGETREADEALSRMLTAPSLASWHQRIRDIVERLKRMN